MTTAQTTPGRPPRHLPAAVRLVVGLLLSLLVPGCFRAVAPAAGGAGINDVAILRSRADGSPGSPQNPNSGYGWDSTDFHLITDDLGSVVAATDRAGAVVERYAYDDFGSPTIYAPDGTTVRAASLIGNDVLFTGARWHADLGLYWMRYRWYDPATGRFLTQDPIGLWGDPFNLGNGMAYVGHSPGTWVDLFGLETWCRNLKAWGEAEARYAAQFYQNLGAKLAESNNGFVSGLGVALDTGGTTAADLFGDSFAPLDLGTSTGTVAGAGGTGEDWALALSHEAGLVGQALLTAAGPTGKTVTFAAKKAAARTASDVAGAVDDAAKIDIPKSPTPNPCDVPPAKGEYDKIGSTGKVGEDALAPMGGQPHQFFPTSDGPRFVDRLVDRVGHESKFGRTSLSKEIRRQILKDAELVKTNRLDKAVWHFYKSPVTKKHGPTKNLREFIEKNGIEIIEEIDP